jgi:type IX secretion system PorP/SprF family membrane protein
MYLKIKLILISLLVFVVTSTAQQMPVFSQYSTNGFLINPAYAGYDGFTTFNLTSRQQWIGLKNAPSSYAISSHFRLLKRSYQIRKNNVRKLSITGSRSGKVGLGVFLFKDKNGVFNRTGLSLAYAYHIAFPNAQLSFGISSSFYQFQINLNSSSFRNLSEPTIAQGINQSALIPDAGVGVYYYTRTIFTGFSVQEIFQSYITVGNNALRNYRMKRNYYLVAGYKYTDIYSYILEPSILIKTTEQLIPQADMGLKLYYKDDYWFGLSYRTLNTLIAQVGISQKKLYIGYSFDYSFSPIQQYTFGSHEITISVKFGDNARRYRWLNRY